jgi:hypothetical protein
LYTKIKNADFKIPEFVSKEFLEIIKKILVASP